MIGRLKQVTAGWTVALVTLFLTTTTFAETRIASASSGDEPLVQVAVLLDTSNSMDGLINQARASLWRIVTELARSKRKGQTPRLEVALYEYGNDRLAKSEGHIRQVVPLTTDLDRISDELFALTTNGGSEHCGQVIERATKGLEWSKRADALKLIFIAGNEPFTQGPTPHREAVRRAIEAGININTVFCGNEAEGIKGKWAEAAQLADGRYSFIDSNREVAQIAAPQDAELARLGTELNRTYLAYGSGGKKKKERMMRNDSRASSMSGAIAADRVTAKASKQYASGAGSWDLVQAAEEGSVELEDMDDGALPAELQNLSAKDRTKKVAEMSKKRKTIEKKIKKLSEERRGWLAENQKRKAAEPAAFDEAIIDAIHEQGEAKAFSFK